MRFLKACLRLVDDHIERVFILVAYASMAGIIVYAVFERFILGEQVPWSTSIPIYLFLWVTWIGCSYNVKQRTHLVFNDVRTRLPYRLQFACMWLDAILWIVFGLVVIWFTWEQTMIAKMNWAFVPGTDDMMQWWFYLATPLAWALLIVRVLQNLYADWRRFQNGEPFLVEIQQLDQVDNSPETGKA